MNDKNVLSKLATSIAHEVINPLTGVKSRLYLLGQELSVNLEVKAHIEAITQDIDRIEKVIRDLQLYANPPLPELREFSLAELCEEVTAMFEDAFRASKVSLNIVLNEGVKLKADRLLIRDVIYGLIKNALDVSSEQGRVDLIITQATFGGARGDEPCVQVEVTDSGPGVPKALYEQIFEPFFTTKVSSMGLSLAICKRIVNAHEGTLEVEASVDERTTFVVKLPVA